MACYTNELSSHGNLVGREERGRSQRVQWVLANEPSHTSEPVSPREAAVPALDPAALTVLLPDSRVHITHLPPTTPSSPRAPVQKFLLKSYN